MSPAGRSRSVPFDSLLRLAIGLLFPQPCVQCGAPTANRNLAPLCRGCLEALRAQSQLSCIQCDQSLARSAKHECGEGGLELDFSCAVGLYQGVLRTAIQAYKFRLARRLSHPLVELLNPAVALWFGRGSPLLIPVPAHPRRVRERGFDHTLILAQTLAARSGLQLERALSRVRHTASQLGLNRRERQVNLRGAFRWTAGNKCEQKDVLLLDDVVTSGATVGEAVKAIRSSSNVRRIGLLALAKVAPLR